VLRRLNQSPRVVSSFCASLLLTLPACRQQETPTADFVTTAVPLFQSAIAEGMPPPRATTMQVMGALGRGDIATARQLTDRRDGDAPADAETLFTEGMVLVAVSSFSAARTVFEDCIRAGPSCQGSERAFYFLGVSLTRLGEAEAAHRALDAYLTLRPEAGIGHSARGDVVLQEGDPAGALAHFDRALGCFALDAQRGRADAGAIAVAHLGRTDALMQLDRHQDALHAVLASLEADPRQADAWYKLSRIQAELGQERESAEAFRRFATLNVGG
jgi:tetratricopeptide (TPR) repeat protein